MDKVFIYYSLTGNGDVVANYLKEKGIDIKKVISKDRMPKNKFFSILKGGFQATIEKEAKIEAALKESGIDLNDEEACELFRMKEGFRLEYREELQKEIDKAKEDARLLYEKEKKKALKEMKKAS